MGNTTVRTVATAVISVLFNTGLTVSGFVNLTVALVCWALMVPVMAGAFFWPQVWPAIRKLGSVRLRSPFTTATAQTGGAQVIAPTFTQENPSDAIQRRKAEIEWLKAENERLQTAYNADRTTYRDLLVAARQEGSALCESDPGKDDAQEWARHLHELLEAAEGKWIAEIFKNYANSYSSGNLEATKEQDNLKGHIEKLTGRIQELQSNRVVKFRPGFDPHDWKDWKSPPPTTEQAESARLRAKLQEVEQERDSLRMKSPEEVRELQQQRRGRLEKWRAEIRAFDFQGDFTLTETYSEMRAFMGRYTRERLEFPYSVLHRAAQFFPRQRGPEGTKRFLLDEVARIEKEWGVL